MKKLHRMTPKAAVSFTQSLVFAIVERDLTSATSPENNSSMDPFTLLGHSSYASDVHHGKTLASNITKLICMIWANCFISGGIPMQ